MRDFFIEAQAKSDTFFRDMIIGLFFKGLSMGRSSARAVYRVPGVKLIMVGPVPAGAK